MSRRSPALLLVACSLLPSAGRAAAQSPVYPVTRRDTTADTYFGRTVADPYRWLEELDAPATRQWVEAENTVTFDYLDRLSPLPWRIWAWPRRETKGARSENSEK